jgi:F-box/leucine-rich repeat protein 10/11
LTPEIEENLHSYYCDKCSKKHGQSVLRRKSKRQRTLIDYVALDSGEAYAVDKSQHPHLTEFQDFAAVADLTKSNHYIIVAEEMSRELAFLSQMKKPILLPNADVTKNGMALPVEKGKFTIDYITDHVGDDAPVVVMDVLTQQGVKPRWNMGQWRDYFKTPAALRDRIRNVIS